MPRSSLTTADSALDHRAADCATKIDQLGMKGIVVIGDALEGALDYWPDRVSNCVIATGPARNHWRAKHPELLEDFLEHEIVRAVLDPDAVHRGQHPGQSHTAIFFRRIDDRSDIVVVVSIAVDPVFLNSVITARKQKTTTRTKRERQFGVWTKD